jgi:hypothetical protein
MGNLLSTAKKVLKESAIELYSIYAEDLPLEKEEFKRHYSDLGELIFEIDSIETLSGLILKLEEGDFDQLGYCKGEDGLVEEFLREVNEAQ